MNKDVIGSAMHSVLCGTCAFFDLVLLFDCLFVALFCLFGVFICLSVHLFVVFVHLH